MACTLIAPLAQAQNSASHGALLPRVQHLHYGPTSIPLCSLTLSATPHADPLALLQLRSIVQQHCPTKSVPAIPIRIMQKNGPTLPGGDNHTGPDSREAYSIAVSPARVEIAGNSPAAIFYAIQTLRQLIEGTGQSATVPLVEINDWPSLPYRGLMMDTSHGGVPTLAEAERQIDELSRWKANQYFFYVETNLRLKGYPLLQQDSDWTSDDIRKVVAYARERHVDVVPCVELYGHLHDIFRVEKYSDMAALPHGGEANPANPEIQKLLEDWLRQYAALFPSPWLHIGFDEPFELERAGSRAAGGIPPDVLWLRHLQHLANVTTELGKRPLFWADIDEGAYIFNKYPGLAAGLPKGAIAVPWFYDARPDYSNLLDLFAANHVPILIASGISDWDNIAPDFDSTFINIDGFLAAGRKAGALGLLNTVWSDSALALHREASPAFAYGAVAAWQSQPVDRAHFFAEFSHLSYPPSIAAKMSTALDALTQSQSFLRQALGSETSFRMWDDPFEPHTLQRAITAASQLRDARLAAESAQESLLEAAALSPSSEAAEDIRSLILAARMLDYTGMKFLHAVEIAQNFDTLPEHPSLADIQYLRRESVARNHSRVDDLLDSSGELQQEYREEWLKQYKPYRLQTALIRWQAEQLYWRHLQASFWTIERNFKAGDPRPTLTQLLAVR